MRITFRGLIMVAVLAGVGTAAQAGTTTFQYDAAGNLVKSTREGSVIDPKNCGSAHAYCPAPANGFATCEAGTCAFGCKPGYVVAGGGCLKDGNPADCGPTHQVCPPPTSGNGHATCANGVCGLQCDPFGLNNIGQNSLVGTACVALATDPNNCGTPGNVCGAPANADPACTNGACDFVCRAASGYSRCGSSCVNLQSDRWNCRSCGNVCPTPTNASSVTCSAGTCGFSCTTAPYTTKCSNLCANLAGDATNCGVCGNVCVRGANAAGVSCTSGTCHQVCSGTGMIENATRTGCVNSLTDVNNCGWAGHVCTLGANGQPGTVACSNGTCTYSCASGYTKCSGTCRALSTDAANCGSCGRVCGNPGYGYAPACSNGKCRSCVQSCGYGSCSTLCFFTN